MQTLSKSLTWTFLEINADGVRHSEIARRLRVTGYPAEKITETSNLGVLKTALRIKTASMPIFWQLTAMLEFRELLASHRLLE